MGMEPLSSISSMHAQSMTKQAPAPKPASETTEGTLRKRMSAYPRLTTQPLQ